MLGAWMREVGRLYSFPLVFLLVLGLLLRPTPSWWLLFNVALWPVVAFVSIVIHELGHAMAARLVGLRPRRISIGAGPRLGRTRIGGVEVCVSVLPIWGLTMVAANDQSSFRARFWLTIAAGPLATGALLLGLLAGSGVAPLEALFREPALAAFGAVTNLVLNLLPATTPLGQTDGRLLLTVPGMKREFLGEFQVLDLLVDADAALERGDHDESERKIGEILAQRPESFAGRVAQATLALERGDFSRARALLTVLRTETAPTEHARLTLANNLAWAHFLSEEDEHRTEADALSSEVVQALRGAPFALNTRGAVLTWLGRTEEACALLERAYVTESLARNRAVTACCLALSWVRRGDFAQAKSWMERARQGDPRCVLLPRAQRALDMGVGPIGTQPP